MISPSFRRECTDGWGKDEPREAKTHITIGRGTCRQDLETYEARLVRIAHRIESLHEHHARTLAETIGRMLLDEFWGGHLHEYLHDEHNARKTLGELSELTEVSRSSLSHAIRLPGQRALLGDPCFEALSLTHHKILFGVQDQGQRRKLAHEAVEQKWSSRKLERAIGHTTTRGVRGRPRKLPVEKFTTQLGRAHALLPELEEVDIDSLDVDRREILITQLTLFQRRGEALLERLRPGVTHVEDDEL